MPSEATEESASTHAALSSATSLGQLKKQNTMRRMMELAAAQAEASAQVEKASSRSFNQKTATSAGEVDAGIDQHTGVTPEGSRFVLYPSSISWRMGLWEGSCVVLLLITAFEMPMRIAFGAWYEPSALRAWSAFEVVCDFIFMFDVALNFFVAFDGQDRLITEHSLIARHYASTWFCVDLLGSFPFDWCTPGGPPWSAVPSNSNEEGSELSRLARTTRFSKLTRLLKLLKLLRLVRLTRVNYLTSRSSTHREGIQALTASFTTALRYLGAFFIITHVFACIQFFFAHSIWPGSWVADWIASGTREGTTWVFEPYLVPSYSYTLEQDEDDLDRQLQFLELCQLYSGSMFHATGQLIGMHVGITNPRSVPEFWMSIITLLAGATIYAGFLGIIASAMQERYAARRAYRAKMTDVVDFIREHRLPDPLPTQLFLHYSRIYPHERLVQEDQIFSEVSPALRQELKLRCYQKAISALNLPADREMKRFLADRLTRCVYGKGDKLMEGGQLNRLGMHIILRGSVELYQEPSHKFLMGLDWDWIEKHHYVCGEMSLLRNAPATATVKVVIYAEGFRLAREAFQEMLTVYPKFEESLKELADSRQGKLQEMIGRSHEEAEALHAKTDAMGATGQERMQRKERDFHRVITRDRVETDTFEPQRSAWLKPRAYSSALSTLGALSRSRAPSETCETPVTVSSAPVPSGSQSAGHI